MQGKFEQNIDKQSQILQDANAQSQSRDVMRMMYWTQTGVVRSIKGRDKKAWTTESKDKLRKLWAEGGYGYMKDNVPRAFGLESPRDQLQALHAEFHHDRLCRPGFFGRVGCGF